MTKIIKLITIIVAFLLTFFMARCGTGIFHEVESGDTEAVRVLLDKDPELIHSRDKDGYTMLHWAARKGRLQLVELLVAKGAPLDIRSHDGSNLTPLHLAASEGRIETAKLLIDKGADLEACSKGAHYKDWSALVFAIWNKHKDMVELLIRKGAAVKPGALRFAVYKGHKDIVELLVAKGAEVDAPGSWDRGPLHIAVEKGHLELVQLLLEHGADVNRSAHGKRKPLHGITYWKRDNKEITRLLLAHGAEVNAIDSYRETALHKAACNGLTGTAMLLLEKGASADLLNDLDHTPLDLANSEGRKDVVRLLLSLHNAAKQGNLAVVTELVKTYPQLINARDPDFKTPLHHAAENDHLKIARLLIANGAEVNTRCKYKRIRLLHGLVAKLLVPRVGRTKRIKEKKTPLDFALQKGFSQMAHLLKDNIK
jgi:ankyrin repeat protein